MEDAIITVNGNGASYSTQPPGSGNCTTSESRRFDITSPGLSPGANTVVAVVFNANGDEQTGSATYYYDLYALQVAGGMEKTVTPGSSGSVSFFVFNTGGSAANADLSVTCGGLANCTITGQDPLPLNPQQSKEVVVNFTAGLSDGDPVITLTATYVESPSTTANGNVVVHVRTPVDHVVVQPSPVQVAVSQSTAVTATVYDANNNVLSGRTVSWSVGNSSIATVNPSTGTTVSVFGQSIGSTTVTAGSEGKSFTANVWVGSVVGPTVSFSPPSGGLVSRVRCRH